MIGLIHNSSVNRAKELVDEVVAKLGLSATSWTSSCEDIQLHKEKLERTSTIFTFGGDGTILRVTRIVAPLGIPIVGVNMGRVGFMTELTVDECINRLPFYLGEEPRIEKRSMLQASITNDSGRVYSRFHALNDVVISRGTSSRILDIEVTINEERLAIYRADGLIAATATGSTGYSLSAGGPIMYPESTDMLIQPLAAHISFQTGVLVHSDSAFEFGLVGQENADLTIDGFSHESLQCKDRVVINKSPHIALFLRSKPSSCFYSSLTSRLGVQGHSDYFV